MRLELADVSKAYPGVQALSHVSVGVAAGEIHGLVGENGAGKSTLMAIASGALMPDTGTVLVDGTPLGSGGPAGARARGVAIVRQEPSLMPHLTVAENLYLSCTREHRPPHPVRLHRWAEGCLEAWRDDCGIDPGDRVATLGPEGRFVVEIAKALAQEPSVLLLDEPTEHLGPEDVDLLFEKARALAARGCAIVYISHRIREVRQLVDGITVLRNGVARAGGKVEDFTESEIVNQIVGRPVETAFPAKPGPSREAHAILELDRFSGPGFSPVDLQVRRGEIIGLAGIDGNGQRELLRALGGLAGATKGAVRVDGKAVKVRRPQDAGAARIAYLPNDRHREGVLAESSVRENLSLRNLREFSRLGVIRSAPEDAAAGAAVAQLSIQTPTLETPVGSLSGGNQQKTVLAGVLAGEPRVLLADEPTQGVDVGARIEIYQILRDRAEAGVAVIVLASDALELVGLCDRVLIFSRGQVAGNLEGEEVSEEGITRSILTATTVRERSRRKRSRLAGLMDSDATPPLFVALAAIALGIYAAGANDFYLTTRNFQGIFALVATLSLVAMGQQMAMLTGGIDLSVGPLMGLIVVVESFFLLEGAAAGSQVLGWVLLVLVALAVGALNWALIDLAKLHPMVATLVTYMGLQGVSLTLRPTPEGLISVHLIDVLNTKIGVIPVTLIGAIVIAVALQIALYKSTWGVSLRAIGSNFDAARLAGVRPRLTLFSAYAACSLLAALAAIPLLAQVGSGDPTSGVAYTLTSVAAAVIGGASLYGGRGSFVGCVLGALLIQQVASVTTFLKLDAAWQSYLLGGMILAAVALYSKARQAAEAHP